MANIDFFKLAVKAAKIADDKKAIDTIVLDVRDLTTIANYFVVTTAESTPQINAVSGDIEKTFKAEDVLIPVRREGISSSTWRVIDYGGIVIHVMSPEVRASYNLESVWREAKIVNLNVGTNQEKTAVKKVTKTKSPTAKKTKKVVKSNSVKKIKRVVKKIVKKKPIKKAKSAKKVIKKIKKITKKKK